MKQILNIFLFLLLFACSRYFDFKEPFIVKTNPSKEETGIETGSIIKVEFSEKMSRITVEKACSLNSVSESVKGKMSWENDKIFIFTPLSNLFPGMKYTLRISKEAEDINGNNIAEDFSLRFRTSGEYDRPYVVETYPEDRSQGIPH